MKQKIALAIVLIASLTSGLKAQSAPDVVELTRLLKEFLDGASRNDAAIHDRFWADDLIYTGSSGRRIGKADIMRDQRSPRTSTSADSSTTYSAEDIRIQQYENTAVVAFKLVAVAKREGKAEISNFFNTGTFLKRNGKWQAVSWQATRLPRSDEDAKKSAAATEAAFYQAILKADTKALERLADANFIWTGRNGDQIKRQRLLDVLGSGELKYSKIDTVDTIVSIYGDSAIVRGVVRTQRASISGNGAGGPNPIAEYYTMMIVNREGAWKVVALHSSGA